MGRHGRRESWDLYDRTSGRPPPGLAPMLEMAGLVATDGCDGDGECPAGRGPNVHMQHKLNARRASLWCWHCSGHDFLPRTYAGAIPHTTCGAHNAAKLTVDTAHLGHRAFKSADRAVIWSLESGVSLTCTDMSASSLRMLGPGLLQKY